VIDESGRMWKEAVVAPLRILSDNLLRQRENDETLKSEQPASGRDLHQELRNTKHSSTTFVESHLRNPSTI
jgi:hypothetical protein